MALGKKSTVTTVTVESSEIENIKSTNRVLIVILIIGSFFLGSLTNKIATNGNIDSSTKSTTESTQAQGQQPPTITNDTIKAWAKEIGLNTNNFNSCFDSNKYKNAVDEDAQAGQAVQVNGTPTFFINGTIVVGAQPYSAFKTIIDKELGQGSVAQEVGEPEKVSVENGHLPSLGNKDAKVKIVEFSDFECPFCRRFFTDTFSQLKKDYIDAGKVVFYYRHFPLPFHPLAQPFAQASECANEQGKFWEFHDKIFGEQG